MLWRSKIAKIQDSKHIVCVWGLVVTGNGLEFSGRRTVGREDVYGDTRGRRRKSRAHKELLDIPSEKVFKLTEAQIENNC